MISDHYKLGDDEMLQLARGYIERYSHQTKLTIDNTFEKNDINFWAYEKLDELAKFAPDIALQVILMMLNLTENGDVLDNLAAGPLEDLVRLHGKEIIHQIEVTASGNAKFRDLLQGVWQVGDPTVWARIEKLLQGKDGAAPNLNDSEG